MRGSITGRWVALLALALAAGCGKSRVQPISGQLALQTFAGTVTSVQALRPGAEPIAARVALDGRFELRVPRGKHYHLEFIGVSGQPVLVFPRAAAPLAWTFDVRGGGTRFDVGTVRYVGDPLGRSYTFVTRQRQTLDGDAGAPDAGEDDECEDGKDVKTGATCVDDDDDDHEGKDECGEDDDDDDVGDCAGVVPMAGAPCPPAPPPGMAAVADHNLPAVMGTCTDDEHDDD